MKDGINARGDFSLQVLDAITGDCLEKFEEKNLVVSLGHSNIAKLLGGDVAGTAIAKIAVGTNGTAPALGDSSLTNMFSKPISGVAYPEANSVRFSWSIDATESNGITIREFGLLNAANTLCARKVRTDIVKTSAVRLVGTWKISIN
jgi:hypothetical protein